MAIADTSKVLATWDYTLEALDPPIRLATFHVQPIKRPCAPAKST